jgi:hypothetical protein
MAYKDKFPEKIDLELDTVAMDLVVKIFMQEGELRFRDKLIEVLTKEVADSSANTPDTSLHWEDGVNYVIHLLKEIDLRDSE